MSGKRMIDESICIDKRLNSVSEGAENLFYRLLSKTDDVGNVFADADLIQGQIYPRRKEITLQMIESRLKELHEAINEEEENPLGLIALYYRKGQRYAHFPNFFRYQKLRKDIAPKILYPAPSRNDLLRKRNEPFTQDKLSKLSKKVSKQEIEDFKKIYDNDKEGLKRHLIARGFKPAKIKSILRRVFGNIAEPEIIEAAKKVLKELSTEALLEIYHSSKDIQEFKEKLINLGYPQEKIDKINV